MGAPGKWPGRVTCRAWHEQQDRDQDCYQDRRGSGWDPARAVSGVGGARRMPTLSSITFASRSLWWARLLNTPVTAAPPITPARPATASIHPERSAIAVSSPIGAVFVRSCRVSVATVGRGEALAVRLPSPIGHVVHHKPAIGRATLGLVVHQYGHASMTVSHPPDS
jgi:hypothetical protein